MPASTLPAGAPQMVSIVIPFFNEGESISVLLEELREVLGSTTSGPSYEVIAIDDGSTDDTSAKLQAFAQFWPTLRFARHQHNQGQASALWTGSWFGISGLPFFAVA